MKVAWHGHEFSGMEWNGMKTIGHMNNVNRNI